MSDLSIVEGVIIVAFIGVLAWAIWASRRTRRFRAGIFVERNGNDDERS